MTYELRMNGSLATATVYIYPQAPPFPATLQDHFSATLAELRKLGQGSEVVAEDATPIRKDGQAIERRLATLLFRGGFGGHREPTMGFLTLSKIGSLWLKWRITVPASAPDELAERFEALTATFVPSATPVSACAR